MSNLEVLVALSVALQEAYAAVDVSGDILHTLEFNHPTFDEPQRFVQGTRIAGEYEAVSLPVPGNLAAVFKIVDFGFTLPSQEEGGVSKAKIRIDNVSGQLQDALRGAISSDYPFTLVYRTYSTNDLNNPEVYFGLNLRKVSLNAYSAEGELSYEEVEMQAFPGLTYDLDLYPALYGQ
ncbi:hypothetical protein BLM15_07495 [Bosea sp. Tri-49]|nr:hypothetical protein BLM15_07495 [Bosea sp. Tri-49]